MKKKIELILLASAILAMPMTAYAAEKTEEKPVEAVEEEKAEEAKEEKAEEAKEDKVKEAKKEIEATASIEKVLLNKKEVAMDAYSINRSNYVKIRDVAALLKDTKANFLVEYDGEKDSIIITKGENHNEDFVEAKEGTEEIKEALPTYQNILNKAGEAIELKGYHIEGTNYFRLKDLGEKLGFGIGYDYKAKTVLLDSENLKVEDIVEEDYFKAPTNKIETEAGEQEVSFLIYGFEECLHCQNLKKYLKENGIKYLMRDIRNSENKKDEVFAKFYPNFEEDYDRVYYPTNVITLEKGDESISKAVVGFSEEEYNKIFEEIKNNTYFVEE